MEPLKGGHLANPKPEVKAIFDKAPVQRTPVDWALQFVWNRPEVSLLLSGMSAFDQVKQNLVSADKSGAGKLSVKELDVLKQVGDALKKAILIPCTACEYCMACPSGVAIPRNFAILNGLSSHKNLKRAKKEYGKLAASKDALNAAKDNGMATLCSKCKKCLEKCPQSIDIPAELEKVNAVLTGAKPIEQVFPKKE
jgi:predicted aldo/keto reductase-like oxidoreductase